MIYVREPVIAAVNGLSPIGHQARTNSELLSIGLFRTNLCEFVIRTQRFSFEKLQFEISSAQCWSFCSSLEQISPDLTLIHYRLWLYLAIERNPYLEGRVHVCIFFSASDPSYTLFLLLFRIIVWFHIITHRQYCNCWSFMYDTFSPLVTNDTISLQLTSFIIFIYIYIYDFTAHDHSHTRCLLHIITDEWYLYWAWSIIYNILLHLISHLFSIFA